ncbi:alginate lyase family protein [uncultured Sphingomonas sp.]|uniref:alginate lyase family protein n=1 Tax=uncultured Sphingomonas sp. TaxID=158754 RepID=UPI0025FF8655|nr:alginate lyase family protein [uncultured Sphingomonas sp.]
MRTRLGKTILLPVLAATAVASPLAAADFSVPKLSAPSTCRGADGHAAAFGGRRTFLLDPAELTAIKAERDRDPAVRAAYAQLIIRADAALARKPGSVMDKTTIPLSGDRHDYLSLAPYWWPDPANPNGPYLRRDGEVNPRRDTRAFDRTALGRMSSDAATLSLAYYYSDDPRYAAKATTVIRTWFLDPATRMNPNMTFAQAVPGRENGRAEGVLDTSGFMGVIDAIGLIGPSDALSADEVRALEDWFARYLDWMQTSANGKDERAAKNNHGIWWDAQAMNFALFARRPDVAGKVLAAFPKTRVAVQMDPSGALPAELARTRSFHYSIFALMPAYDVATLGTCLGYDLWRYTDDKGRGLRRATDYLAPYRGRAAAWPLKELKWPAEELDTLLTRAEVAWGPGAYRRASEGETLLRYRR